MKEKLTLEHLAAYLPHRLIIVDEDMRYMEMTSLFCNGYVYADWGGISIGDHEYHINEIKPVLHPLSKLTQEIEHNGEKFIPLNKLSNHAYDIIMDNNLVTEDIERLLYRDVIKLIEWHFDVFDLLSKNLAIEK